MRILIVDDDFDIRQYVKDALETAGFAVDTAGDGADGSYLARVNPYDLVVLDFIMPRKNGKEVLEDIRSSGKTIPVIMLSVAGEPEDKAAMLDRGADDYLAKPFSNKELVARVRALLRRPAKAMPTLLRVGDLALDTINQRATRGSKDIYLTRKEFALAEYLVRNTGTVVSRGMLMEHVWNESVDPFSNTIETHIRNLRKKIDEGSDKKLIDTVPGRGYKINARRLLFS